MISKIAWLVGFLFYCKCVLYWQAKQYLYVGSWHSKRNHTKVSFDQGVSSKMCRKQKVSDGGVEKNEMNHSHHAKKTRLIQQQRQQQDSIDDSVLCFPYCRPFMFKAKLQIANSKSHSLLNKTSVIQKCIALYLFITVLINTYCKWALCLVARGNSYQVRTDIYR